jgi:hypothetical protein
MKEPRADAVDILLVWCNLRGPVDVLLTCNGIVCGCSGVMRRRPSWRSRGPTAGARTA